MRTDGFGPTLKRSAAFLKRRFGSKKGRFLPKKETLAAQRALDYGALGWPAVSICVPLYNTPQKYLRQLLDSVLGQTCPNWQLCLADASDAAHGDVAQTVRAYQARDARIVYTKVENKGISANTNAAAALARRGVPGPCRPRRRAGASCGIRDDEGRSRDGRGVSVQRRGVVHFGRAPAHGRPLQTGFCAGLPQLLQLHLPFFRVPKGSVRRCGRAGPCL